MNGSMCLLLSSTTASNLDLNFEFFYSWKIILCRLNLFAQMIRIADFPTGVNFFFLQGKPHKVVLRFGVHGCQLVLRKAGVSLDVGEGALFCINTKLVFFLYF